MSVTDCLFIHNDSLLLVNTFYFISKDRNEAKPCHRINLCILLVIIMINNLPECGSRSEVCSDLVLPTVWSDDWGSYNRRVKVNNTSESYLDMRIRTPLSPPFLRHQCHSTSYVLFYCTIIFLSKGQTSFCSINNFNKDPM